MSTRPLLIAMVLGLVLSLPQPRAAHAANCTGVCNPDYDECCKDDCTYEDQDATCIPFNHGESCRTKQCDYVGGNPPTCTKGGFNNLPTDTDCIGSDPCNHGTCDGSGVCINQNNNPCEDGNQCTDNTCAGSGVTGFTCTQTYESNTTPCTISNPDPCKNYACDGGGVCAVDVNTPNKPNGTACGAFPSPGSCLVKTCSSGACTGSPNPGSTPIPCVAGSCQNATCSFHGSTLQCDLSNKLKGTVCDTDPWDCKHQRCNDSGACKEYKTTTLKECDADTNTAAHCKLSYCDSHKHCRTAAAYIHTFGNNGGNIHGTWNVEDATTAGRNNRNFTWQFLCPQTDGNFCTSDRCDGGGADSCHFFGCDFNEACPVPQCGTVCDTVNGNCTCRF